MTIHDKLFGDIPDRYKDTTPVEVKVAYVNKAEKRVSWNEFADVGQLQALLQPRIDSAGRLAEAWERYLLREALRLGCWRIWFVQTTVWGENRMDSYTKVFPSWQVAEAQALAKCLGEHVVGLNLKRWLLMPEEQFQRESGTSPNKDIMSKMRRVMSARCIAKCAKNRLKYRLQAIDNAKFKINNPEIFEGTTVAKEYWTAFKKIPHHVVAGE